MIRCVVLQQELFCDDAVFVLVIEKILCPVRPHTPVDTVLKLL
jgi:hypothetical protein